MYSFACQSKQWHDQTPVHENYYKAHTLFMNKINTEEKGIKTNVINNIEDLQQKSQNKPF
jgi:hypothetical protein